MNKTCFKCRIEKDVGEFYQCKGNKDRLGSWCKKCFKEHTKQHYLEHKEACKLYSRQYHSKHKEERNLKAKQWKKDNPDKIIQQRINNKEKRRPINNLWQKNHRKNNIGYKILDNSRGRQRYALNGAKKSAHTMELIGCTIKFFKTYLFNRFYNDYPGLTLHLPACEQHHIIPCYTFNLTDPEQQRRCFHYTNVKLMPREDHRELHRREGH